MGRRKTHDISVSQYSDPYNYHREYYLKILKPMMELKKQEMKRKGRRT